MESFSVIDNIRLSDSTFILRTERPDCAIRAGQCFSVGTRDLGINREYSMYSAANDPFVDFLIREVSDGIVSPALAKCKKGDQVEIGGPYGSFCLPEDEVASLDYVFIASGTGIAPFHSYVKTFPSLSYRVFHGVRFESEQYDAADYQTGTYISAVSRPTNDSKGIRVTDLLREAELPASSKYYLCGNRLMITDVVAQLKDRGVPGGNILMETFF